MFASKEADTQLKYDPTLGQGMFLDAVFKMKPFGPDWGHPSKTQVYKMKILFSKWMKLFWKNLRESQD